MCIDLTQTSYSTIPSVDMELGNAYSDHGNVVLEQLATGLLTGILTLNSRDFAKSVRYAIILFRIRLSLHGGGWTYERNKE